MPVSRPILLISATPLTFFPSSPHTFQALNAFQSVDADHDGVIDREQMLNAIKELTHHIPDDMELREDMDGHVRLTREEFVVSGFWMVGACLALPCLALPCLALPCLAWPGLAWPGLR
jgi:hypothetical protein